MTYGTISFGDTIRAWRFVIPVVGFQLAGAVIGIAIGFHHHPFMNLWIGAALAMPAGMIIGAVWHNQAAPNRENSLHDVYLMAGIGVLVFLMAVFGALPRMMSEMQYIADVSQLDPQAVGKIQVFDRNGRVEVLTITDPVVIADFAESASDAVGYAPNHEQFTESWYLIVTGPTRREYELHVGAKHPDSVIGYFVEKDGSRTSSHGSFRSNALRDWVKVHLM